MKKESIKFDGIISGIDIYSEEPEDQKLSDLVEEYLDKDLLGKDSRILFARKEVIEIFKKEITMLIETFFELNENDIEEAKKEIREKHGEKLKKLFDRFGVVNTITTTYADIKKKHLEAGQ